MHGCARSGYRGDHARAGLELHLKSSPGALTYAALTDVVIAALREHDVEVDTSEWWIDMCRRAGRRTSVMPTNPAIHNDILASDILVIATPTWLGQPSSVAKLVLERMDAMISEKKDHGTYTASNKVAGVVVPGMKTAPTTTSSRRSLEH
jgi:hypothetical protein